MTSDERALLQAIQDRPEDNTARLVYADWLDEESAHGSGHADPRAAHIRAGVDLDLLGRDPDRAGVNRGRVAELVAAENDLCLKHLREWSRIACPSCGLAGVVEANGIEWVCPTCLPARRHAGGWSPSNLIGDRRVRMLKGFLYGAFVNELDAFQQDWNGAPSLSNFLVALVRGAPLEEVWTGIAAEFWGPTTGKWGREPASGDRFAFRRVSANPPPEINIGTRGYIPWQVFDRIKFDVVTSFSGPWGTEKTGTFSSEVRAEEALARGVVAAARAGRRDLSPAAVAEALKEFPVVTTTTHGPHFGAAQ